VQRDALGGFEAGALTLTGRLSSTSVNGVLATGAYGSGTLPAEGYGVRMMWYPRRAAFRAGAVDGTSALGGTDWNDGNIGDGSVAFGTNTRASGQQSTAMGLNSQATAQAAVAIGYATTASGIGSFALGFNTTASGEGSTALGVTTTASGLGSMAMGYAASTNGQMGSFVFGDASNHPTPTLVTATGANQFVVRAAGGTTFYSSADLASGVTLPNGAGDWEMVSDRNRKQNFRELDGEDVLSRIRRIPVSEWSYKAQGAHVRHIGPMAQDFHAAFGLGTGDLTITGGDLSGVNLRAIQSLIERSEKLRAENESLRDELSDLKKRLDRLEELASPRR
jgi:hypothetical protein